MQDLPEDAAVPRPARLAPVGEPTIPRPIGGQGVVVRPPSPVRAHSTSLKVHNVQAISAGPERKA